MKESFEQKPAFDIQKSLEAVQGVSDVRKIEFDPAYFKTAEGTLSPEVYETIKANYAALEAYAYDYLSDDLSISGFMWAPKGIKQPLPITIWNRGGTGRFSGISEKPEDMYATIACDLAKQGSVIVASQYRGGPYSEGKDERGGADLHDVIRIKEIADQLPICKPGKAIVAGGSRGGMMSYMLAAKEPWVKAVISLSGTTDLFMSASPEERPEMQEIFNTSFGGSKEEMAKRSATHFYSEIPKDLPLLIMQGSADDRVSVEQARKLNKLLSESGHAVEYHEFPNAGHYFYKPGYPERKEVLEIIERFMKTQLNS